VKGSIDVKKIRIWVRWKRH